MKVSTLALTAATTIGVTLAQPHKHQHAHLHDKRTQTETTWISGPTAYAFMLDGKSLSVDEVCDGVKNNQLKWADGAPAGLCTPSASSAASSSAPAATTSASKDNSAAAFYQKHSSSSDVGTTSSAAPAASSSSPSTDSNTNSSQWSSWNGSGSGMDSEFPDGQLDCSTFPSEYGALPLTYLGMHGWSGLQAVKFGQSAITDISTGISGDSCQEGMMCSYACPPGYQKSQWPSTQGATGQSVGGIQCKGGKLHLTNPTLSKSLCIQGKGGVEASNKASGVVAICRLV